MMSRSRKIRKIQPEVQVLQSGLSYEVGYSGCTKKADHKQFISVKEFEMEHLPAGIQCELVFNFALLLIKLTGMLTFTREDGCKSFGTAFVQKVTKVKNKPCPCPKCCAKEIREWAYVEVSTNFHVVPHQKYAEACEIRLFFDRDTPEDVANEKILHGMKVHSVDDTGDWCAVICVTHDLDLIKDLEDWKNQYYEHGPSLQKVFGNHDKGNQNAAMIVSHPHGGPKCVSFGEVVEKSVDRDVREGQIWCSYSYNAMTCNGSSGALVYVLGRWRNGYGYWFGHSQNHRGVEDDTQLGRSSIGVESEV